MGDLLRNLRFYLTYYNYTSDWLLVLHIKHSWNFYWNYNKLPSHHSVTKLVVEKSWQVETGSYRCIFCCFYQLRILLECSMEVLLQKELIATAVFSTSFIYTCCFISCYPAPILLNRLSCFFFRRDVIHTATYKRMQHTSTLEYATVR